MQYALVKCTYKGGRQEEHSEYLLLAEKRIAEFMARSSYTTPLGRKVQIEIKSLLMMQGEQLREMTVRHHLLPTQDNIPTVIYNAVSTTYGTGVNAVIPGHDIDSLKVASAYPHLEKAGCVDTQGRLRGMEGVQGLNGLDVREDATSDTVLKTLERAGALFRSFKYQNTYLKENKTGERILMLTKDSWFMRVGDRLKMRCLQELAHVKYVPGLNLKSTEETHKDHQELMRGRKKGGGKQEDFDAYYFNIVEEINEFNDWCISEDAMWGIPIPYFVKTDGSEEVLMDNEVVSHVAEVFRRHGGSDAWYRLPIEELLPNRYKPLAGKLEKGDQVFDVWFDNALSWNYVLGGESDFHERNQVAVDLKSRLRELADAPEDAQLPGQQILKMLKYDSKEESDSRAVAKGDGSSSGKKLSMKDYLAAKKKSKQPST